MMILDPTNRSLYTKALTPPRGMNFDCAVGTSFSVNPEVLLTVPVFLSSLDEKYSGEFATLDSLRRFSKKITVFVQKGNIQLPREPNILFGLLDKMIVEVDAPPYGVFHPKIWVIRFINADVAEKVLYRLMILSRNLTKDRSWDLNLTLEGNPTSKGKTNSELSEIISKLPKMASNIFEQKRKKQILSFARELKKVKWNLPESVEKVNFHFIGPGRKKWFPKKSSKMVVISPFCADEALIKLANSTTEPIALISQPETLDKLNVEVVEKFKNSYTLKNQLMASDDEESEIDEYTNFWDVHGLHAKAYIYQCGEKTHIAVGSANATINGLTDPKNVEILAELVGESKNIGHVEDLFRKNGLKSVLEEYIFKTNDEESDLVQECAKKTLEKACKLILEFDLRIKCYQSSKQNRWNLDLTGIYKKLNNITEANAWLLSAKNKKPFNLFELEKTKEIPLGEYETKFITGMLAVELYTSGYSFPLRFILNLPVKNLPRNRDGEILKSVISDSSGFYSYLQFLVNGRGISSSSFNVQQTIMESNSIHSLSTESNILEGLVRVFCREPDRFQDLEQIIKSVSEESGNQQIVPKNFEKIWKIFRAAKELKNVK